tara:strand:- start:40 stop:1161 length:1122 start_codon:yes stop_codon:yes gene_type:complete
MAERKMVHMRNFKGFFNERISLKAIGDMITQANPHLKAGSGKPQEIRVQPLDVNYNAGNFPQDLQKAGLKITKTAAPGNPLSKSSKFTTYYVKDSEGIERAVTLGGGAGGAANKGNSFETQIEQDLINYNQGSSDFLHTELIQQMIKEFDLKPGNFGVLPEGAKNQKRSLEYNGSDFIVTHAGESVGETVTDITIVKGSEKIYLSLKYGPGISMVNTSPSKFTPVNEIKSGFIKNNNGIALLKLFNIDNKTFCRVFNEYGETNFKQYHTSSNNFDRQSIETLITSIYGDSYYMVHSGLSKKKGSTRFFEITKEYTEKAAKITTPILVKYGGVEGNGKRIDIFFESEEYKFNLNIRNTDGAVYPNKIQLKYDYK